jgi:aminopeptidase
MSSLSKASGFDLDASSESIKAAAKVAVASSLKMHEGETLLIVTNPEREVFQIAAALYDAASELGAKPSLIVQPVKTQTDYAEEAVIASFESKPDAFISLSAEKLGKDREGLRTPYDWDGVSYDHVFHYQLYGAKTLRAFWSPGVTLAMFAKSVPIDYAELRKRCATVAKVLSRAVKVHVTNAKGSDIIVDINGRTPKIDNGDFSSPGSGGNLPAGEVFVSPRVGASEGTIVFDGSIAAIQGCILIREPIACRVQGGYVVAVEGGSEAAALRDAIASGEESARKLGREGSLSPDKVEIYARNAKNIGELGIGLNPMAAIVGNMLEDEKAFHTCHFAIGANYDDDAPALIHIDGLVTRPTIVAIGADGRETVIERDGELLL